MHELQDEDVTDETRYYDPLPWVPAPISISADEPCSKSCIVFTTTTNKGKVDIFLDFKTVEDKGFGLVHIKDEPWSYCFPSGELQWYILKNTDGDKWVGDVSMTHSEEKYGTLMQCENCNCQCTGTEAEDCSSECLEEEVINLGLDDDSNSEGETKCLMGRSCPFRVIWSSQGTLEL